MRRIAIWWPKIALEYPDVASPRSRRLLALFVLLRYICTCLLCSDSARGGLEFLKDHAFGKHLRKDHRFFVFSRVEHVQWNARAPELSQQFRDRWIAISPIGFQFNNPVALKRFSNFRVLKHVSLIKFASQT